MSETGTERRARTARPVPRWLSGTAAAGAFLGLCWFETRRPLRRREREPLDVEEDEVGVGVPACRDPADLTLPKVVEMPFTPARPPGNLGPDEP